MHLLQYLRREGLSTVLNQPLVFLASNGVGGDVQHIWPDFCSGGFDSLDDLFGEGLDVAIGRVEDDSDDWFGPIIRVRSESAFGEGDLHYDGGLSLMGKKVRLSRVSQYQFYSCSSLSSLNEAHRGCL
jgi:hypothetical protein